MNNIPRWAWWFIGITIVLIVVVLLKINIQVGSSGIHLDQGLVK